MRKEPLFKRPSSLPLLKFLVTATPMMTVIEIRNRAGCQGRYGGYTPLGGADYQKHIFNISLVFSFFWRFIFHIVRQDPARVGG